MKLTLLILLTLSACNSSKSQNDIWRQYFASDEMLKDGYVKKTVLRRDYVDYIYYDKVFLQNDTIILERYNEKFEIVRKDYNTFNSERMVLVSQYFFFPGMDSVPVNIIEPIIAPYKPTNEILVSKIKYSPRFDITISVFTTARFISKEAFQFRGREIECLKFTYDEEFKIINTTNSSENIESKSTGYTLWGENIGLVYMKFKEIRGMSEYRVIEILSISEFEILKL